MSVYERRLLVDRDASKLSITEQAALLDLNRTGLYYKPVPPSKDDLFIKLHIDKIYTAHPEYGYRRICWWLNTKDHISINHKAVLRHMREMGIQAIYPRQNTSKANPENKVYPYLLRGLNIDHPDHVWSMDIAYILMLTRLHEIPESGSTDLWPTITASGHTQVSSTTHRKRYVGAGSNSSASLPCRMVSGDRYMRCQGFLRKLQAADP